jgi:hypothetical protein
VGVSLVACVKGFVGGGWGGQMDSLRGKGILNKV